MSMRIPATIAAVLSVSSLVACSQTASPPVAPTGSQQTSNANATPTGKSSAKDTSGTIAISEEIRNACGIAKKDAHFAFDSARIDASAGKVLGEVAKCFDSGPLAGRELSLVGRTDPRGDSEYNMVLGGQRASAVSSALESRGLASDKISSSSRGEMDATGTDESTWADDRRVDVRLGSR